MAIFRLEAKVIGRSTGRSVVAAAAYRAGALLHDERLGRDCDFRAKHHVVHSEILAPIGAPAWARDRAALWNKVEGAERRRDAQLARELVVALPRELTIAQQTELVRDFVDVVLVADGMVADVGLHVPPASDGGNQPHAHILLPLRRFDGDNFAKTKAREWNSEQNLDVWRQVWAATVNRHLAAAGHDGRVDHRRLEVQRHDAAAAGDFERAARLDRAPQPKLGSAALALERRGVATARGAMMRAVCADNRRRVELWRELIGWLRARWRQHQARQAEAAEQAARAHLAALVKERTDLDQGGMPTVRTVDNIVDELTSGRYGALRLQRIDADYALTQARKRQGGGVAGGLKRVLAIRLAERQRVRIERELLAMNRTFVARAQLRHMQDQKRQQSVLERRTYLVRVLISAAEAALSAAISARLSFTPSPQSEPSGRPKKCFAPGLSAPMSASVTKQGRHGQALRGD